ncbi:NuoM family protein [Alicyclobacillus sp. SO9]|uniref:complex I subunit 4 family protein n=1 Tax=Alicyclobacillus sp. SO9 TaxID=2665646 RepID=UPI0018E81D08|nr:NADH-quinone oxidoreductase subunit M [Alicyclobacillus sp. SO9]QQE78765.1 NADH-quinone oxidoreductase subunit M [Alicyclobacillus sp. SO9]
MGLVSWIVAAPLLAAALILILPKLAPGMYRGLAWLGTVVAFILTFVAWGQFSFTTKGAQLVSGLHTWFTLPFMWQGKGLSIGLLFGVDGLSLPLVTLTVFVALLALMAKNHAGQHEKSYYLWMQLAVAGVLGVFTAQGLFAFLLGLELSLFSTFFLIFLFGGENRRPVAFKFLIYRGFATVALLVVFIALAYGTAGALSAQAHTGTLTFSIPALTAAAAKHASWFAGGWRSALFIVLLLGVFIEEAFVPLHTWLPDAHEQADTPTNMLLGGILTKTGAYVLLRIGVGMMHDQVHHFGMLIAILGIINILYGAFAAWAAKGWRRLIAFGGISHMGIVLLGIAALNAAGLQGAMFMIVSSGLLTAMLFLLTGSIEERTTTSNMDDLGGLSKTMPRISGFLLFAALGSLGLPLTSGFISEIQAFIGGFAQFPAVSFVGIGGIILSAVYLLYAIQRTTFGPLRRAYGRLSDATVSELVPTVVLTALVLVIGVYPHVIGQFFGLSVKTLLGIGG